MTFAKKYDPKDSESRLQQYWEQEGIYVFDESTKKPLYSIDTPPPTMSGRMHVGHAFSFSQIDFIARYKRMNGYEVYFPFGTDDNGLATEKLVQKETGKDLRKLSREEAIQVCIDHINKERPHFIQDWKDIGMSCDFRRTYSTIDDYSRRISQKSFLQLARKGRVYRKEGPIMWDRVFQTAIAQAELEDKTMQSYLTYNKAKIKGTEQTYLLYATTRPELLHACVGMSVEDKGDYVKLKVGDEYWITGAKTYEEKFSEFDYEVVERLKGEDLIGEVSIIPISGNEVTISHDVSVNADYGTGAVYYCTYGGLDCVEWMSRHPDVSPIEIVQKDGTLNEKAGRYAGMLTSEAREEIIKDLASDGSMIKKESVEHVVNVGERSGAEVEYIISKQWYVQYLDLKDYFWEQGEELNWYPDFMKHRLENWIKGLNWDWGISRQRHFGVPIPVWYDAEGNIYYPEEDELPVDPMNERPRNAPEGVELIPETDVFDTWFTSGSSPFLAIDQVEDEETRNALFPLSLRPQAHDIINFWLFYTLAKTTLIHEENPWKDVAISGWVLDPKGKKMSKSKGNIISPQDMMEKYSADALRFAAAATKLGEDVPFPEKELVNGTKVTNKLYQANKFASMLLKDFEAKDREFDFSSLPFIDQWIVSRAQEVIKSARNGYEEYDFWRGKTEFEYFFMHDVADNYIEIVKNRLWNPEEHGGANKKAQQTLYYVLHTVLRGMAPIIPFVTEEIYQNFYREFEGVESIHLSSYPEPVDAWDDAEIRKTGERFLEVVGEARRYKTERSWSMKAELEEIRIEASKQQQELMASSLSDLKAVTGARKIRFEDAEMFSVSIISE